METDNPLTLAEQYLENAVDLLDEGTEHARRRASHAIRDAFAMLQSAASDVLHNGYKLARTFHKTRAAIDGCRREQELQTWIDTGFTVCSKIRDSALLQDSDITHDDIKPYLIPRQAESENN